MVHKKRHHFLAQFSISFQVVWSVLLQVVAQKTTFWPVEIFWQPIRSFYPMVFEATTRNKMKHNMWKGIENCARKWCLFLCTILFEVTRHFVKCDMWDWYPVITRVEFIKLQYSISPGTFWRLPVNWVITFPPCSWSKISKFRNNNPKHFFLGK